MKQGDPLSLILFIIVAKVLSRSLNNLFLDGRFIGYGMPKWSPKINHLAYTDDTILFRIGDKYFIIQMMKVINNYEKILGQKVNKEKSYFYVHDKSPLVITMRQRKLTGLKFGNFPLYLSRMPFVLWEKELLLL